jgi:uncharacterized protein YyaL (SSP411 family)
MNIFHLRLIRCVRDDDVEPLKTRNSPYVQQHADNPVDWLSWGEQALTLARTQDKL